MNVKFEPDCSKIVGVMLGKRILAGGVNHPVYKHRRNIREQDWPETTETKWKIPLKTKQKYILQGLSMLRTLMKECLENHSWA